MEQQHLDQILRIMRADALIRQAETIRDHPDGTERAEVAMHIREAMLQRTLGNLTADEEYRIYSILSFAMPDGDNPQQRPDATN